MSDGLAFDPAALVNTLIQSGIVLAGVVGFAFAIKSDTRSTKESLAAHAALDEERNKNIDERFGSIAGSLERIERETREGGYMKKADVDRLLDGANETHRRQDAEMRDLKEAVRRLDHDKLAVQDYRRERERTT